MAKTLRQMAGAGDVPAKLSESVVLVVDAQKEYLSGALVLDGIEASVAKLAAFLQRARREGAPVIHIVHHGAPGGALFDPLGENAQIIDDVSPQENEPVLIKKFPSSFTGTALLEELQKTGRTDLIITGYMAHMCVNSTVREAAEKGFSCTVVEELTATRSLPDGKGGDIEASVIKQANLAALADRFAIVLASAENLE